MDRRNSIKALLVSGAAAGAVLAGCHTGTTPERKATDNPEKEKGYGRTPAEQERDTRLKAEHFFTEKEMATITVLADIIIPADEHSGSAAEAGVPDFIAFIVKDQPEWQVPLRGGLRWLDMQMVTRYGKSFVEATAAQRIAMVDLIAYPEQALPEMSQGVTFFNHMRDLTATGFYTTKIGVKDLGYIGNAPNEWDGPPEDVLAQYNLRHDEKYLPLYLKMEDRGKLMTWDD